MAMKRGLRWDVVRMWWLDIGVSRSKAAMRSPLPPDAYDFLDRYMDESRVEHRSLGGSAGYYVSMVLWDRQPQPGGCTGVCVLKQDGNPSSLSPCACIHGVGLWYFHVGTLGLILDLILIVL